MSTLVEAVDDLYRVFARYTRPTQIAYCDHCQDPADFQVLLDRELEHLSAEDLDLYVGSALYTVGSVEDFKHYLPRILELLPADPFTFMASIVASKFHYAGWRDWPAEEKRAIEHYFLALWRQQRRLCWHASDCLCAMGHVFDSLEPFLAEWVENSSPDALEARAQFVFEAVPKIVVDERCLDSFWPDQRVHREQIVAWLRSSPVLGDRPKGDWFIVRAHQVLEAFQRCPIAG